MFTYKIDNEIQLALPQPQKHSKILFELIQKKKVEFNRWLPWVSFIKSPQDEAKFLQTTLEEFAHNQSLSTIILYKDKPVGMISLNRFDNLNKTTEIGYWLASEFSGKRIMHRAVHGICDIAFNDYGVNKIEIHASVNNDKSNHVAEKAGFHLDGIIRAGERLPDGFHDSKIWSLLRFEWQK